MVHLDRVAFLFEMKAFSIRFVELHLKMFLLLHPKSENQFRPSSGQVGVNDLEWPRVTFAWPFPMNQKIYDEYLFQMKLKSCPKSNFLLNPSYLKHSYKTSKFEPSIKQKISLGSLNESNLAVYNSETEGWMKRIEQIPVSIQVNNKRIRSFIF